MKYLLVFFAVIITSETISDCQSGLNGLCVHFTKNCPHGYGTSYNHCDFMTYCCYPLHTGSQINAGAPQSSNNMLSPATGSFKHNECETAYKGYCIDYKGTCQTGHSVMYGHCGFLQFCCHPFEHITGTGSPTTSAGPIPRPLVNNTTDVLHIEPDACGISMVDEGHRIVGGGRAEPHEYPWQVSLRYRGQHLCGGTLIGGQWVLTAAHCFRKYRDYWSVGVGLHDIYSVHLSQVVNADRIFTHSGYSGQTNVNDIALVKLMKTVDTNHKEARTACLPEKGESFDNLVCTVTGWGAPYTEGHIQRYLHEADVPIVNNKQCSYYMGSSIHPTNICAGYRQGGKDACQGDSGGPLVCQKGGVWKIAGIVSWGIGCGERYAPGVYTRVSAFRDWIEEVMGLYV